MERIGCRRLWALIEGLPAESVFHAALRALPPKPAVPKPGHGGWRRLIARMGAGR